MNINSEKDPKIIAQSFVQAFQEMDTEKLSSLFDPHIVMYTANAEAGVDKIEGRDELLKRFQSIDYTKARLKLTIPHMMTIEKGKVMMMIHVTARKDNIDFENFSAFLCDIKNDKITSLWQVDAKPANSDEFWKRTLKI